MAKEPPRRYSIEIKDDKGKTVVFMAGDWTDDERRVAVAQVLQLLGLPADSFTEPESNG
jgi:hypothetical protein